MEKRTARGLFPRKGLIAASMLTVFVLGLASPVLSQDKPSAQTKVPPQTAARAPAKPVPQKPAPPQGGEKTGPVAFGYDVFRQAQEPITEGPISDQYILSPGDEVIINVWGQLTLNYKLTVSDEGYIEIPDVPGRIFTNGLSLRDLKTIVAKSLAGSYAAYINIENPAQSTAFVDVKLGAVRKLLVYVVGEVENPGPYTVSAGVATLPVLLSNAGGVKDSGSLREIKIRRADGTLETVDLYDFLITGRIEARKTQVRSGDYIIVPLKAKSVTLKGEVKRPGIYEAIGNEGIRDLVRFAGGLAPNAAMKRAQVRRYEIDAGERYIDINLEEIFAGKEKNFVLEDADEITIFPNIATRKNIVEIQGKGIMRPGQYQFTPGMRVHDLIDQAEGLKEDIYLDRADFIRTNVDYSKRLTIFSLRDLYELTGPGQFKFIGTPEKDFPLRELDIIVAYSAAEFKGRDKTVTLEGRVKEPGSYPLAENQNLFDIIFSRGGFQDLDFRKTAYLDLAHLFRKIPGDQAEKMIPFNLGKLLDGDESENMKLESGDRIVVYSYETMSSKPTVSIKGLVKRPGVYPAYQDMTLEDLILTAGGLSLDAYKVEALIARSSRAASLDAAQPGESAIIVPLPENYASVPTEQKTKLEAFDSILIRNLPDWEPLPVVSVEGQIVYAGSYSLSNRQEKISALVQRAGGLRPEAFPEGATLYRRKDLVEMAQSPEAKPEEGEAFIKVAIDLKRALDDANGPYDLIMKDGDRLYIPTNPGVVEVRGAVRNPATLQYKSGESLDYYIRQCGGYLWNANKSDTAIFKPNGAAVKRGGFLSGAANPTVLAGSVIDVPFLEVQGGSEVVNVRGAVKFPLAVQAKRGETLAYYVKMCGGFRDDADVGNVTILFPDGSTRSSQGIVPFDPVLPAGAIVQVPTKEAIQEGATVEVRGAVRSPRAVPYRTGLRLEDCIQLCSGYREDADIAGVKILLPDGTALSGQESAPFNPILTPGSIIDVPVKK